MPEANGRDAGGRFVAGNAGGPGNPFARRVAALRSALFAAVSPDDVQDVARALVEGAKAGDVAAARLVLSYLIGRPAEALDPDALDDAGNRVTVVRVEHTDNFFQMADG